MMKNVIGLFGVCGNTTWRQDFMTEYAAQGIEYFNPQVADWKPELAQIEAEHLVSDNIILFPITGETYAFGSLAEIGFAVHSAAKVPAGERTLIILIDKEVNQALTLENPAMAKESNRTRALVRAHLAKINHVNVGVVDSMEEMLEVSIEIYERNREYNEDDNF